MTSTDSNNQLDDRVRANLALLKSKHKEVLDSQFVDSLYFGVAEQITDVVVNNKPSGYLFASLADTIRTAVVYGIEYERENRQNS